VAASIDYRGGVRGRRRPRACPIILAGLVLVAPVGLAQVRSRLSIYNIADGSTQVIYTADRLFEAPNWSPDGTYLMINMGGDLYRVPLDAPQPQKIDLGGIRGCNNDHGISPDGKLIAFSARHNAPGSQVYVANADGSNARLVAERTPSYYHGWSPDGKWLAYVGQRGGEFDTYRVSVSGGEEQRLTTAKGLDDGPDYSPDGKWIYINSDRTGNFDIWRFPAEGAGSNDVKAQQVTSDEWEDWFPHPSPDGKWLVMISFERGTQGHPANRNVQLRLMPLPGDRLGSATPRVLVKLFGGQGTINVNSWAPDSKRFAFVSYEQPRLPLPPGAEAAALNDRRER
jgi:Tol biopolymer transport system component